MKPLKQHITESFIKINESDSLVGQSFSGDAKSILKELKKAKIKAELYDVRDGVISIPKNQAKKANDVLKKINAFDDEFNFVTGVEPINESMQFKKGDIADTQYDKGVKILTNPMSYKEAEKAGYDLPEPEDNETRQFVGVKTKNGQKFGIDINELSK
jgi:hypothetical protein